MKLLSNTYIYIMAGLLLTSQCGCNKITDLKPINEISDVAYWKTPDQFRLATNEFYTYLRTFTDVISDNPHADVRSDLITGTAKNAFSNGNNTLSITDGNWNAGYTRLRAINYMLDKAATYPAPADIATYVAEAKFFRAYVYFDLLQQFGEVPLIDKPLGVNSEELQAPRNKRDEVVDFIIKDLEEAITALPLESAIVAASKGRISKGAAQAMLARVSLYEGTWQKFRNGDAARYNSLLDKAITNSDAVISSAQYQLFAPTQLGDSAQKYMFILEDQKSNPANLTKSSNKEYILANRYDFNLRQIRFNVTHTVVNNLLWITRKFANMYLCQDGLPVEASKVFKKYDSARTEYYNRDNRMKYTMMIDSNFYWDNENPGARNTWQGDPADTASSRGRHNAAANSGYANQKWGTERRLNDNEEAYDYPVIRYAEVLLIYAEAKFERDGMISDADLDKSLNLVRNRVNKGMPKLNNALITTNSGLDMRTEIRRERTVEFFLEGFRIDDLKRWKTAEIEMPMPLLGIKWKGTQFESRWKVNGKSPYPLDADGNLILESGRKWSEKNYLYPVPTQQIQLNANLAPNNPGWN